MAELNPPLVVEQEAIYLSQTLTYQQAHSLVSSALGARRLPDKKQVTVLTEKTGSLHLSAEVFTLRAVVQEVAYRLLIRRLIVTSNPAATAHLAVVVVPD